MGFFSSNRKTLRKVNELGHNMALEHAKIFHALLRFRQGFIDSNGLTDQSSKVLDAAVVVFLCHLSFRLSKNLKVEAVIDNSSGIIRGFPTGIWTFDDDMEVIEPKNSDFLFDLPIACFDESGMQAYMLYISQLMPFEPTRKKAQEVWERSQDMTENYFLQPLFNEMQLFKTGYLYELLN